MPRDRLNDAGNYGVGFGRPPANHKFKPGASGNPKGRPKGSLNVGKMLERTLLEKVVINENGKRRTITKLEAAIKQLANKAASGDLNAVKLLGAFVRSAEEQALQRPPSSAALGETDKEVIQGILKRLDTSSKGGKSHGSETE
ncbi:MAG: DUF5681 domain-containing protein [Terracidiphilus sp.]|jgi:hypothetical protein